MPKKIDDTAKGIIKDVKSQSKKVYDNVDRAVHEVVDEVTEVVEDIGEEFEEVVDDIGDVYDVVKVIPSNLGTDIGYLSENAVKFAVRQSIIAGENTADLSKQVAMNAVTLSKQIAKNTEQMAEFTAEVGKAIGEQIGTAAVKIADKVDDAAIASYKNTIGLAENVVDGVETAVNYVHNIGPFIGAFMNKVVVIGVPIFSIGIYEGIRFFVRN